MQLSKGNPNWREGVSEAEDGCDEGDAVKKGRWRNGTRRKTRRAPKPGQKSEKVMLEEEVARVMKVREVTDRHLTPGEKMLNATMIVMGNRQRDK